MTVCPGVTAADGGLTGKVPPHWWSGQSLLEQIALWWMGVGGFGEAVVAVVLFRRPSDMLA